MFSLPIIVCRIVEKRKKQKIMFTYVQEYLFWIKVVSERREYLQEFARDNSIADFILLIVIQDVHIGFIKFCGFFGSVFLSIEKDRSNHGLQIIFDKLDNAWHFVRNLPYNTNIAVILWQHCRNCYFVAIMLLQYNCNDLLYRFVVFGRVLCAHCSLKMEDQKVHIFGTFCFSSGK